MSSSSVGCCRWRQARAITLRDRAPSARALVDAVLSGELYSFWGKNRKVIGFAKSGRRHNGQELISDGIRQPG
jgi:hypothetical protein